MDLASRFHEVQSAGVRLAPARPWRLRHAYLQALHWSLPLLSAVSERRIFTGQRMRLDARDFVQAYIRLFGYWEPDLSLLICERLRPGDVALDIGAHVGYHTLVMSQAVGASGKVFSFEPDAESFQALRLNLAINGLSEAGAVNAAILDRAGPVTLVERIDGNSGSRSVEPGAAGRVIGEVQAVRLEDAVPRQDLDRVRLIKIDTEGVEASILNDLLRSPALRAVRPDILVEISDFEGFAKGDLWERLAALGYVAYEVCNDYSREYYASWRGGPVLRGLTGQPAAKGANPLTEDPRVGE
jgi:FkbM family methyltransferase